MASLSGMLFRCIKAVHKDIPGLAEPKTQACAFAVKEAGKEFLASP